ncbi:MAG: type I-G CRISPR-associated protein Csb2 [Acidimicrobiales bacterium]
MLALDVTWLAAAYEATTEGAAEWPPHPARAFCALVAAAEPGSADDDALRWLEALPPPVVEAPAAAAATRRAYVPTNKVEPKDSHQAYPARTSGLRTWHRSFPARRTARFVWPDATAAPEALHRLDRLARRVPYFGRATSPALLAFTTDHLSDDQAVVTFAPDPSGRRRLRTAEPGYLARLRAAFESQAGPPAATVTSYRASDEPQDQPPMQPAEPAWPHLVTLGIGPGQPVDGRDAAILASAFKAAVLARLGKPAPTDDWPALAPAALELVHGHYDHGVDERRQCAFLALPFVDDRYATGDVLGVAVAVSPHLEAGVLGPLLRLLGLDRPAGNRPGEGPRLGTVRLPGGRAVALEAADGRATLRAGRWTRASRRWDTVLPIVLDRYPRRRYGLEDAVADGCEFAGIDRPERVEILPRSAVAAAPHVRIPATSQAARRPLVHASLHFARPVKGPVLVGHLRHVGLGLCLPSSTKGMGER